MLSVGDSPDRGGMESTLSGWDIQHREGAERYYESLELILFSCGTAHELLCV